jgi:hypothetical protein
MTVEVLAQDRTVWNLPKSVKEESALLAQLVA